MQKDIHVLLHEMKNTRKEGTDNVSLLSLTSAILPSTQYIQEHNKLNRMPIETPQTVKHFFEDINFY